MFKKIKVPGVGKDTFERLYAVIATFCSIAGGYKLLSLPMVHLRRDLPVWQFVGGILIAEVAYHIYSMTEKK